MTRRLFFDFGANKGQNIAYFLKRSDLVIAVEPVPEFCEVIEKKFSKHLGKKLLVVQAFVTDDENSSKEIPFFVNEKHPGVSTFLDREGSDGFSKITVNTVSAASLINSIIQPDDIIEYIKIDCEGADDLILDSPLSNNLLPNYFSIELHAEKSFYKVTNIDQYINFRIEDAGKINSQFMGISLSRIFGFLTSKGVAREEQTVRFSPISSGPFGRDLKGRWFDKRSVTEYFLFVGIGPKDLHASRIQMSSKNALPLSLRIKLNGKKIAIAAKLLVWDKLRGLLPEFLYSVLRNINNVSFALSPREYLKRRITKKFVDFK